ncbi:MAG TPA: polyhydroxyalkanoic acid system family protein [Allosphingosinicella sp.]|nr:polyhydroxyalkanoic acid system family protein [Allosphingosinicella sp.]
MSQPISVDVPHNLGAAEARRRIQANLHKLEGKLPAGATVTPAWEGERLRLDVAMLGQQVQANLEVFDTRVTITVLLPPALAFFGEAIRAGLRQSGAALLEDRTRTD